MLGSGLLVSTSDRYCFSRSVPTTNPLGGEFQRLSGVLLNFGAF